MNSAAMVRRVRAAVRDEEKRQRERADDRAGDRDIDKSKAGAHSRGWKRKNFRECQ